MVKRQFRSVFAQRRTAFLFLASQFSLLLVGNAARADTNELRDVESQTRVFTVTLDGTRRGTSTMQIRRRNDGAEWMRSETELRLNMIVYKYRYTSNGTEVWKDGRLIDLDGVADYNGTRYVIKAAATPRNVQLSVDGTRSVLEPDVWVTSYWQIPADLVSQLANGEGPAGAKPVSLLDSDQGKKLKGKLRRVGDDIVTVGAQEIACTHYRIDGDVKVDLWFDASRRLVREVSQETGFGITHRVRLELSRITAD